MRIELSRRGDGTTTLRCVRDDGSVTWQNQRAPHHAAFFALHDLTHYAVETELGFRQGFYGLVADGWEIEDTTGKGVRGPLPPEAQTVEQLVGALDRERASARPWSTEEFNELLAATAAAGRAGQMTRPLTDEDLGRVRERVLALSARWAALGSGEVLALDFPVGSATRRT
jgi:hypothetical protein